MKNRAIFACLPPIAAAAFNPPSTRRETRLHFAVSTSIESLQAKPWIQDEEKYGAFDQETDWGFAYTSTPAEACVVNRECTNMEGMIPKDLAGIYYKVGAGNFERGNKRYDHVLDGDGFVTAFRFHGGKVYYSGRFVETEYFLAEQKQDKILYRNVFGTQREGGFLGNAFDINLKNVANTNVLSWGGRLFALWEGGRPYELDPRTLETLPQAPDGPFVQLGESDAALRGVTFDEGGPIDENMGAGRCFTAHPVVVDSDTMVAFKAAQNPLSKSVQTEIIEYDREWKAKKSTRYSFAESPSAPHDFAVSDNYYCFFQNRLGLDNVPFLLGLKAPAQVMEMCLDKPTILHIIPRSSGVPTIQVEIPYYFTIHTVGRAKVEGNLLTLFSNGWDLSDERYFPSSSRSFALLGSWGGPFPDFTGGVVPPALFYRTVIDLKERRLVTHEEVKPGLVVEFPKQSEVDPNEVYVAIADTNYISLPGTGIGKINTKDGRVECWWAEGKIFTGEAVPVKKRNGDTGSWVLSLLYDSGRQCTSLGIFDSERFMLGPIGWVHLPHHVSYAIHGCFDSMT